MVMTRFSLLMILVVGGVVARGGNAAAAPDLVVVSPAGLGIDFGPVNVGATSAPSRIRVQNTGTTTISPGAYLDTSSPFYVVGTGGSLGPGEEMYWDIDVAPTIADLGAPSYSRFVITYTDADDNDVVLDIQVVCQIRRTPFDAPDAGFGVGPFTVTTKTVTVTNTSATPKTITGFTSTEEQGVRPTREWSWKSSSPWKSSSVVQWAAVTASACCATWFLQRARFETWRTKCRALHTVLAKISNR
jgi:hypothetical protein